ncbi:MAG: hypothetical protein WDM85_03205 [Caulobacteraceae bacterium]
MDHKPEDALNAINGSRTTILPNALNMQRRVIAARALTGVGHTTPRWRCWGADNSADAADAPLGDRLAAEELAGRRRPVREDAGRPLQAARTRCPSEQEGQLLRAAVAYSLAADDASLARLRARWTPFVAASRNPDALRVALSGLNNGEVSPADFSRLAADNQVFSGWVAKMKDRFRTAPLPAPRPAIATRQATADVDAPAAPVAKVRAKARA